MTAAIDWAAQPLGQVTDASLAAMIGVSPGCVAHNRRKLGIPGHQNKRREDLGPEPPRGAIDWDKQPLGKVSDAELARVLGVRRVRVLYARRNRDIPPFRPQREEDTAPEPPPGPRYARWLGYPRTVGKCRYCAEAASGRSTSRKGPARWTDQGACCANHYASLPDCRTCGAPVSHAGEVCDDCVTRAQWRERESGGWRYLSNGFARGSVMAVADKNGDVK